METIIIPINPVATPRPRVTRWGTHYPKKYTQYKEELEWLGKNVNLPAVFDVVFHIQMPKSWSKKKKIEMLGTPHQQKPDRDNLLKGLQDVLCEEDSYIYDGRVAKYWAEKGCIEINY